MIRILFYCLVAAQISAGSATTTCIQQSDGSCSSDGPDSSSLLQSKAIVEQDSDGNARSFVRSEARLARSGRVDQFQKSEVSSVCGAGEEIQSTNCLGDSLVASQAKATARMMMSGSCCTAWLVKGPTATTGAMMLTTGHCAESATADFQFLYKGDCGDSENTVLANSRKQSCQGTKRNAEVSMDQQGIYELVTDCPIAATITPIVLDVGRPDIGEGMYIIGHPNCRPQLLSHEEPHDEGSHCEVREFSNWGAGNERIKYYCDTQGGNSGSPVFSARTGMAFAIHSHGGCSGNKNSKNWGGLLENPGNVAAFKKYGIPYVNRQTTTSSNMKLFRKSPVVSIMLEV